MAMTSEKPLPAQRAPLQIPDQEASVQANHSARRAYPVWQHRIARPRVATTELAGQYACGSAAVHPGTWPEGAQRVGRGAWHLTQVRRHLHRQGPAVGAPPAAAAAGEVCCGKLGRPAGSGLLDMMGGISTNCNRCH